MKSSDIYHISIVNFTIVSEYQLIVKPIVDVNKSLFFKLEYHMAVNVCVVVFRDKYSKPTEKKDKLHTLQDKE